MIRNYLRRTPLRNFMLKSYISACFVLRGREVYKRYSTGFELLKGDQR